ncbi:hypothetical protein KA005_46900 [bacterium]|nr:hypothetical protein [bacterium]
MVVKPEDLEKLTDEDKRTVKVLEKKIDAELKESDSEQSRYLVVLDFWPSARVMRIIEKMYKNAGWGKVDFISSQRDGQDYVELFKKK